MTRSKWLYAVGDIHGCFDQLLQLLTTIEADAAGAPFTCVFLGDYVDRGPQSREVVDVVKTLCAADAADYRYVAIRGNHEQLMLDACRSDEDDRMIEWLENGGDATTRSYAPAEDQLNEHLTWLASLPLFHETEHHFFVHAGVNPRYALNEQPEEVMLWTRNWERHNHDFGKHIVYGHTPFDEPRLMAHSTGLDTGACYGGPLSAGVFDPGSPTGPVRILNAV